VRSRCRIARHSRLSRAALLSGRSTAKYDAEESQEGWDGAAAELRNIRRFRRAAEYRIADENCRTGGFLSRLVKSNKLEIGIAVLRDS